MARELLKNGADINAVDGFGRTALHVAAWEGHTDTVRELLGSGADVNARADGFVWTVLHMAAEGGHTDTVRELLRSGADVNAVRADAGYGGGPILMWYVNC